MTWSEVYALRPVVMVSENLAREMWGTPSAAIGKHLREFPNMPWHEVVGVIQDVREKGLQENGAGNRVLASVRQESFCPRPSDGNVRDPQRSRGHGEFSERGSCSRLVGEFESASGFRADHAGRLSTNQSRELPSRW